MKKYSHTLLFTIVDDKNVKWGRVISIVPHLGHNFGYRLFCVTFSTCLFERIPKSFKLLLIVMQ